ncbi:hypothetical protein C4569_00835 [Candidatus Parcubacteria bacterium]|nr:MAG: hypothetical protein C4569_00835 [Candidatus Parcubacteria bacterium]
MRVIVCYKKFLSRYYLLTPLVLGALMRLLNLTRRDFWYDEAVTGYYAQLGWQDMILQLTADTHPPLYFASLKIFGYFFSYNVFSLRFYSAAWGIIGIIFLYFFSKKLLGKKIAYFTLMAAAASPFAVQYSQEARMYTMALALTFLALICAAEILNSGGLKNSLLFGFISGLAVLTSYIALIYLFFLLPALIIHEYYKKKRFRIGNFIPAVFIFLSIAGFWILPMYSQIPTTGKKIFWVPDPGILNFLNLLQSFIFGLDSVSEGVSPFHFLPHPFDFVVVYFLSAAGLYLLVKNFRKNSYFIIFGIFAVPAAVFFYSLSRENLFLPRYLAISSYFLFMALGMLISKVKKFQAAAFFAAYLIFCVFMVTRPANTGYNLLAKDIASFKNYRFYVLNPFDYAVAEYYFGKKKVILFNSDNPAYNPSGWLGLNQGLERKTDLAELKNDRYGIVIWNDCLPPQNLPKEKILRRYDNLYLLLF